jgi:predicted lipoprotein with Yx(FWY)xxD motif
MNKTRLTAAAFSACALLPAIALAGVPVKTGTSAAGPVLTDAKGMTLYVFDKDADGKSACYDKCAANWPPLIAEQGAAAEDDFGLAKRDDGSMQWTYYGKPLYLWVKDSKPGDVTGDGVKDVWHVAKPQD